MKVAGIAKDLTFDLSKKDGYNFVAPVFEDNGKCYIMTHKSKDIYELIEMAERIEEEKRDTWLRLFLEIQDRDGKDIGSVYNNAYVFLEYEPMFCDDDMLREVDDTFHVQPDIDLSGDNLVMGFSLDEDVFIGNAEFIIGQIELFIAKAHTDEEFDILYHVYAMAQKFDKMKEIIEAALVADLNPAEKVKWVGIQSGYEVTMQVEEAIKTYKAKKKKENVTLKKEM